MQNQVQTDEQYMQRALDLARMAGVHAAPNPMVGAVIVYNDRIIGEGFHERFGGPHAEVNAVADVADKSLLSKATIYVTLEPCAHFGKTPPCANLLVYHKFKRVVIATVDPHGKVAGKGITILKEAGIEITVGVLEKQARELNKRFFTFHQKSRPFVLLKWAQSSDGFIDLPRNNESTAEIRWISQPETQVLTHTWRSEEQTILVGWRTIANDNPTLTTRAVKGSNPIRLIIDPELKAPSESGVFTDGNKTVVFTKKQQQNTEATEFVTLSDCSVNEILNWCYDKGIASILVEGGRFTTQQFIDSGLWDEARIIQGKVVFKSGTLAPEIKATPRFVESFGLDTIYYYYHD
jgi:diaminohydroxyphosphoribosylaminopyrimidine deaminase/5-amino-6-(5-phosphoribosylamino)uracil reductase